MCVLDTTLLESNTSACHIPNYHIQKDSDIGMIHSSLSI